MTVKHPVDASRRLPHGRERAGEQPAAVSFLVRFWLEPRQDEAADAPHRGYARDLRTGEEGYFRDPRRLAEHIVRRLQAERRRRARRETGEVEDAIDQRLLPDPGDSILRARK